MKCRSSLDGKEILSFPAVVKGKGYNTEPDRTYLVGKDFAYWVDAKNTFKDCIWFTVRK